MTRQKPKMKFSAGSVSGAIWENSITGKNGKEVTLLKATVERRYKDNDGNWRSTGSFSRSDLPLAIWCLQKAFDAMITAGKDEQEEPTGDSYF